MKMFQDGSKDNEVAVISFGHELRSLTDACTGTIGFHHSARGGLNTASFEEIPTRHDLWHRERQSFQPVLASFQLSDFK